MPRYPRRWFAGTPQSEWVYDRPNASVVMASFLHVAPGGMHFNGEELGAWYAAATVKTAIVEVAHHLRREAIATGTAQMTRDYRTYSAISAVSRRRIRHSMTRRAMPRRKTSARTGELVESMASCSIASATWAASMSWPIQ